jgi:hypothetical protein
MTESFEYVSVLCSLKRGNPVKLSLRVTAKSRREMVTGVAITCACEGVCPRGVQCLLGKKITLRIKKK